MNLDTIKAFFAQFFTELNNEDSWAIIFFLVVTFLLGLLFGWWAGRSGKRRLRKALKQKESDLISLQAEHEALKEKFEMREKDLEAAKLEAEERQVAIERLEMEKTQMQNSLYAAKDQVEKLQTENLSNLSLIDGLTTEVKNLEEQALTTTDIQTVVDQPGIETGADQEEFDLLKNSHDVTVDRLAAIEAKLGRLEGENSTLREELSAMKDTSAIAFIDEEPNKDEDEEIEIDTEPAVSGDQVDAQVIAARQSLKALFGTRIPAATAEDKDDLQKINGVGPFIEGKLNEVGIYNLEQISHFDDQVIQYVTDAIQFFPGRIKRDDWVGQAATLIEN